MSPIASAAAARCWASPRDPPPASLPYVAATGFLPILLIAAAQGIAASAINPLADSLALALAREGRIEYGPVRAVGSTTFMVATAAGGLAAEPGRLLAGALAAGGGLRGRGPVQRVPAGSRNAAAAARHSFAGLKLFGSKSFRLAVGCTALIQGAHAAYYGFAALFWRSQGLSDTVIGLLIAEGIVAEILLFARGRRLVERLGPAGLTACAAVGLDFALDGDGGRAAFAGAGTDATAARRNLCHAAFVGDAGADPRRSPPNAPPPPRPYTPRLVMARPRG